MNYVVGTALKVFRYDEDKTFWFLI